MSQSIQDFEYKNEIEFRNEINKLQATDAGSIKLQGSSRLSKRSQKISHNGSISDSDLEDDDHVITGRKDAKSARS